MCRPDSWFHFSISDRRQTYVDGSGINMARKRQLRRVGLAWKGGSGGEVGASGATVYRLANRFFIIFLCFVFPLSFPCMPHGVCVINDFWVCVCERVRARHCWNSNNNICMKLFMSSCRSCCQCQSCWRWRGWCFACLTLTMWMTITSRRGLCLSHSLACLFPFALSASTSSLSPRPLLPLQPYFSHSCTCLYLLVLGLAGRPRLPFVCCFILIIFGNPASHILCLHSLTLTITLSYTRTHTCLHTCQQKSFTLHCFTQFGWFLLAAYFLRVFILIPSFVLFLFGFWIYCEFTANRMQSLLAICATLLQQIEK